MQEKNTLNHTYKIWIVILCLMLAGGMGVIRYLTGPELALSLFYSLAIVLVTWYVGKWSGVLLSIASATSWLIADLMMVESFSSILIPYINETFRLIVFLLITLIIDQLRHAADNQRELARTDPLTGIANRRAFFELANRELQKARRYRVPLSIIYLDVDNFKQINDHLGHRVGDNLLRSTAKAIADNIRAVDLIARFGGDEFCVLLPDTGKVAALLVAQKLRKKLLEIMDDSDWPVTFSLGIVTYIDLHNSIDKMVNEADFQMYSAKKNGKNRIHAKVFDGRLTVNSALEAA